MYKRHHKVDIMAGSERMLKAHHKNAVFFKGLENQKLAYDQRCTKNLSRMQQDIYEVYFNEYIPLKGEACKIKQRLPQLGENMTPRTRLETIPGRGKKEILPSIASHSSLNREESYIVTDTDRYLNSLREKAAARRRKEREENDRRGDASHAGREGLEIRNESQLQSRCSGWPDNVSEYSESPPIDEKRLQILKTAIALTSQPVKPPEPRKLPRRLRKSFLFQLRRQSKQVWENEVLQRVFLEQQDKKIEGPRHSGTGVGLSWRPSLSKNRILNSDDEDESGDMVFHFADRVSRASIVSAKSDVSRVSLRKDIPLHDIEEDLYHDESSPDIFSVISEHTGSFSSGSFYSSGSDFSYYSSETENGDV